jgi:hypothetical protein
LVVEKNKWKRIPGVNRIGDDKMSSTMTRFRG